jgi:hypothetical protein
MREATKTALRDLQTMEQDAGFKAQKVQFLLDSTLGRINLVQNDIINAGPFALQLSAGPESGCRFRLTHDQISANRLDVCAVAAWEHHRRAGEYSRWFRDIIKNETLARGRRDRDQWRTGPARKQKTYCRRDFPSIHGAGGGIAVGPVEAARKHGQCGGPDRDTDADEGNKPAGSGRSYRAVCPFRITS